MRSSQAAVAVAAAESVASSLGLTVRESIVLQSSNRLTLRLLPCEVVAQVAPVARQVAQFELDLAQQLLRAGCPVVAPDPRVEPQAYERGGWVVTLWTYYAPVTGPAPSPADYGSALAQLHAGMRHVDLVTPHVTDRVRRAQQLVDDREATPALLEADRQLLHDTLRDLGGAVSRPGTAEQLLHGEPHPGNVLVSGSGLLFVDLETCCRGPVEFDLAHAPGDVVDHYPGADPALLHECRILVLALNTTWRWEGDDQLPHGRELAFKWLNQIRAAP